MIIVYCLLLFLILYGIKFNFNGFNTDYIDLPQCNSIKGIFIVFVFVRHILQYVQDSGYDYSFLGDSIVLFINSCLKQLLVALFFFYSGYGVMSSYLRKGNVYVDSFPKKRILSTLINFDIAVFLYLILDLIIGNTFSWTQLFLSFIAWDSIGNSNWYIFAIIISYLIFFIVLKFTKRFNNCIKDQSLSWCFSLCFLLYIVVLQFFKPLWWYDTILCFPLGIVYAQYKEKIESLFQTYYCGVMIVFLLTFMSFYLIPNFIGLSINICSIAFCLLVLGLTMKVRISNKLLIWMGANLFPLYIFQRLPMIALFSYNNAIVVREHIVLYVLICMFFTFVIAILYNYIKGVIK